MGNDWLTWLACLLHVCMGGDLYKLLKCLKLNLMPSFLLRYCSASLVRESEGPWCFRGPGLRGALLDLLLEVHGCHLLRMGCFGLFLLLEIFSGRGEEVRKHAAGGQEE